MVNDLTRPCYQSIARSLARHPCVRRFGDELVVVLRSRTREASRNIMDSVLRPYFINEEVFVEQGDGMCQCNDIGQSCRMPFGCNRKIGDARTPSSFLNSFNMIYMIADHTSNELARNVPSRRYLRIRKCNKRHRRRKSLA